MSTGDGSAAACDRLRREVARMTAELSALVEALTGDDQPAGCGTCIRCKHGIGGCMTEPSDAMSEHTCDDCAGKGDEPQADTPAPEGRWVTVYVGDKERRPTPHWETEDDLFDPATDKLPPEAWDALVPLVRRDGTAPDLTPLFDALDAYYQATAGTVKRDEAAVVLARAVRALRDGAAR